jgi:hypothetical protein
MSFLGGGIGAILLFSPYGGFHVAADVLLDCCEQAFACSAFTAAKRLSIV